jgi:hypothetical protein
MASPRTATRARLGLECLQARVVPAVVVAKFDSDGDGADDIRIIGDAARNVVVVNDDGAGSLTLSIDANGDGDFADAKDTNGKVYAYAGNSVAITAALGAGNDLFVYNLQNNVAAGSRWLAVGLGEGTNRFALNAAGKNFAGGSLLDVDVTGGTARDVATAAVGQVSASLASVRFGLGAGNDTATVAFGNIDQAASVDVAADLGEGFNAATVDLLGVGKFDRANATVSVATGAGADNVALNLHDDVGNGTLASALLVNVDLGGGNDVFVAGLDYEGSNFRVDNNSVAAIGARGGSGNDQLVVRGVGTTNAIRIDQGGLLDINLRGGAGNDGVRVNLGKPDALFLEGTLRAVVDGGAGNDNVLALFANTGTSTGKYDASVLGGTGNDTATFALTNNGGTPAYGPVGKVVLNGGSGADTLTNGNPAVSLAVDFETLL